jgi:hypothetical protein
MKENRKKKIYGKKRKKEILILLIKMDINSRDYLKNDWE